MGLPKQENLCELQRQAAQHAGLHPRRAAHGQPPLHRHPRHGRQLGEPGQPRPHVRTHRHRQVRTGLSACRRRLLGHQWQQRPRLHRQDHRRDGRALQHQPQPRLLVGVLHGVHAPLPLHAHDARQDSRLRPHQRHTVQRGALEPLLKESERHGVHSLQRQCVQLQQVSHPRIHGALCPDEPVHEVREADGLSHQERHVVVRRRPRAMAQRGHGP